MSSMSSDGKVTLKQLGGFKGLIRNPGLVLSTLWRALHVGEDALGNQYYEQRKFAGPRRRRWVVYAGGATDASLIGPEWHAWLHYLSPSPLPDTGRKPWQKPHQPNLTGTAASYRPAGHDYEGGHTAHASSEYQAWSPDLG